MNVAIDSDQTPALVEQFVPRANEGGARGAAVRERIRRALANSYFFGEDAEWLERELWSRLDLAPESKIRRHDAAVAELAKCYVGSYRSKAKLIVSELIQYGASARWRERDDNLEAAPLSYTHREALRFTILKLSGGEAGILSVRQIRRILGQNTVDAMAQKSAPLSIEDQRKDRATMNAMTPHSDQKILEAISQSPEVKKFVADERARDIAERQKTIAAIAALDAKAVCEAAALDKTQQVAIAGRREAEKALQAANDRLNAAAHAKSVANYAYTVERQRLETLLRAGVDAELFDNFQREMRAELDATRKKHVGGWEQDRSPLTGVPILLGYTNAASGNKRLAVINAAMEEAERLRLSADQAIVAAQLDELRAGLPEVGPPIGPGVDATFKTKH